MHFPPPVSDLPPYFSKIFRLENFQNFTFPEKFFHFHLPKFLMTFFSHRPQIFPVSVHFPPCFAKLLFPPTLKNFLPVFQKFTCFLHTLCLFRFPPTLTLMHLCITQCVTGLHI